jgi:O-antigen ligase/tetratricopeptide (TPR) repeat protein
LVVDVLGLQAFDLPKSLFSRGLEWALAALIVLALARHGSAVVPRTWLHLPVAGFLIANVVSTLFAQDPHLSTFGDPDRHLGLTFLLDMAILYVAVAVAYRRPADWSILGGAVLIAAILVTAYATVQYVGLDPLHWTGQDRPFSTLGNPDILGHLLSVLFGLGLGLSAALRGGATAAKVLATGSLAATLVVATRGAILGIGAAVLAFLVVRARLARSTAAELVRVTAAILILVAAATPFFIGSPLGVRARDLFAETGGSGRLLIWEAAVHAWAERPLLGYGTDSFSVAYPPHRQPGSAAILGPGVAQNSAHSWLFQALATTGLIGLLALVVMIVSGSVLLWRHALRMPMVGAPLTLAWSAYWVNGLVSVGSISVDWIPWVTLGSIAALAGARQRAPHSPAPSRALLRVVGAALAIAAVAGALTGVDAFRSNRDGLRSRSAWLAGDAAAAMTFSIAALAEDPGPADHWNRLGLALELAGRPGEAAQAYEQAVQRSPQSPAFWFNLARSRARSDPAGTDAAIAAAESAVASDPNDAATRISYAELVLTVDRCDAALRSAVRAIELFAGEPRYDELAGRAARCAKDRRLAQDQLAQALKAKESAALLLALAELERSTGDLDGARDHALRALDLSTGDQAAFELLRQIELDRAARH